MSEKLFSLGFTLCSQMKGFSLHMGPFYQKENGHNIQRALLIEQQHLNPEGVVHGGVLMSFADFVGYRAIGDDIGHDIQFATINLNTQFLAAAKLDEVLLGEGRIVRKTRSVIFAEVMLHTEQRPVMSASGIWKIIGTN